MTASIRSVAAFFCLFALVLFTSPASYSLCYSCGAGSKSGYKQCRSRSGLDTLKDRKICEKLGCKVTGRAACSKSDSVKICRAPSAGDFYGSAGAW